VLIKVDAHDQCRRHQCCRQHQKLFYYGTFKHASLDFQTNYNNLNFYGFIGFSHQFFYDYIDNEPLAFGRDKIDV
jgi:hypothetical protein